ncbi:hypothetical protein A2U01_0039731, partial [Trifolium medium]|nr:hypothetical protein [Trifolium medium]
NWLFAGAGARRELGCAWRN